MALFTLNCFSSEKSLPGVTGSGQIVGKVVGPDGTAIASVQISTSHKGQVLQTTSANNGTFTINLNEVERGTGFTLQLSKTNFDNASHAAVISLPNLKVDTGNIVMYISGGNEVTLRKITGQVYDNFSYKPLANANVTATDSAGQVLVVLTNDSGRFTIDSYYFALNSSFIVGAYKADYITRTDIVAVITAEENPIRNNPVRLYQKFGAIYGQVTEDSLGTPLNDVSVTLTNSNNQQLTCNSGGPYNANSAPPYEPLEAGLYCPDMDDDYGTAQNGANGGGFKIKDQFLMVGTRYPVTLSKTTAACAARTPATTGCYKTKSTYVDVLITGNNAIAGAATSLAWDAWIHGTVTITDPPALVSTKAHTICPGAWNATTTCAGTNVTVKLYDASNTFVTQTVTNSSGEFLLDHSKISRDVVYKLTFERSSAFSRLIGLSAPSNSPVPITITIAGANSTGAVTMEAQRAPDHCVQGTVKDYWSGSEVGAASVAIYDGKLTPVPSRTATRVSGSPIVTNTATGTGDLAPGMLVAGTGIDADTRIASVLNAAEFQLTKPASISSGDTLSFAVYDGGWRTASTDGSTGVFTIEGDFANPVDRLGQVTLNSTLITLPGPETTADLAIGLLVGGTGVPVNSTIVSIVNSTQFRINRQATATSVPTLKFAPRRLGEISKSGYTGELLVDKQQFSFVHSGVAACPATPFDLDSNTVAACGANQPGPLGGSSCESQLKLYPIGIYANVNGAPKYFRYQTKQTYEKFLTEKTGLTLSGRAGDLIRTSSLPQKTYDFDGIYLHFDDTPRVLPNVPEGKWSNHVPVNPSSSSPVANGVLTEGIGGDERTVVWDLKNYVYYHFYAAQPGSYTIETTGSTDTYITLIAQTGANLGSNDDSGTGSNGLIGPINLLRGWYYVKVRGKNDNVFGFFDVRVTGPVQSQSNYSSMLSPAATYTTNCGTNNGNLVLSWYDATGHLLYVAGPGERQSIDLNECSANATIDMHGPIGDIVRGTFSGKLRPIAPTGAAATISAGGFFNILRTE